MSAVCEFVSKMFKERKLGVLVLTNTVVLNGRFFDKKMDCLKRVLDYLSRKANEWKVSLKNVFAKRTLAVAIYKN